MTPATLEEVIDSSFEQVLALAGQSLKLLTPGTKQRVWDEALDDYKTVTSEAQTIWSGLGLLQAIIRRERIATTDVAGVAEQLPTYRAYLSNNPAAQVAVRTPGWTLVDDQPGSLTFGQHFRPLKGGIAMASMGPLRLELREA